MFDYLYKGIICAKWPPSCTRSPTTNRRHIPFDLGGRFWVQEQKRHRWKYIGCNIDFESKESQDGGKQLTPKWIRGQWSTESNGGKSGRRLYVLCICRLRH